MSVLKTVVTLAVASAALAAMALDVSRSHESLSDPAARIPIPSAEDISREKRVASALIISPQSVARTLRKPVSPEWEPAVNRMRLRSAANYAQVAPAVVVVRTQTGHGTGFFIDSSGVILTNSHVIADGLWHDTLGSYALVHTGHLDADGVMQLKNEPVKARFLKRDIIKDLAILKIDTEGRAKHHIKLANFSPRPGARVSIVGHPSSGMLWTYRTGEISAIGHSPRDIVNIVVPILAASDAEQVEVRRFLSQTDAQKIVLTSAVANPGDSGGPVVDSEGNLVAVTFAVPATPEEKAFSYHVHLDEVKRFVSAIPTTADFLVPDAWEIGPRVEILDVDDDGHADALASGTTTLNQLMFDLNNQTPAEFLRDDRIVDLVDERVWRCDFALRFMDRIAFYDRNADGAIDLVLHSPENGAPAGWRFDFIGGRWRYAEYRGDLIDPSLLGADRGNRLAHLLRTITAATQAQ